MNFCIAFLLLLFLTLLHFIGSIHLSNRIVFTTSREEDPENWFDNENPQFEYLGQLNIGETRYIKARIRKTDIKKKINTLREDPDVEILRQKPGISWVKQEKFQVRKTKTADPEWPNLWYLNDEVAPSMKVSEAWNLGYSGKGIVIAVVDDGLQTDHPDISANIDVLNSVQIKDGITTSDPNPKFDSDSHGTQVAGLIAAVKDNNICIPGVAYHSTILGVQLMSSNETEDTDDKKVAFDPDDKFDPDDTEDTDDTGSIECTDDAETVECTLDSDEASALCHNISVVKIYSNSWGPKYEHRFVGPDTLTEDALRNGATKERNGKGVIYVFAAGNGGIDNNCNSNGYTNSKYTIAITSVQKGRNAEYAVVCAPALAATYGGSKEDRYLTTTDIDSDCTNDCIAGTSFSVPIASGIIAMTLEANSDLTWRDIQHLIVITSNRYTFTDTFSGWSINGANQEFSQVLGFGLMDAEAMVSLGSKWTSVPQQQTCNSSRKIPNKSTTSSTSNSIHISNEECPTINYLEHVEVNVNFAYTGYRGVTQLYLISPAGTKSNLLHHRPEDDENDGHQTWTYMSVHFWGESSIGSWILQISSNKSSVKVTLKEWSLMFYGTTIDPWQFAIYRVVCSIETTAYQSSDIASLNNQSSIKFKDINAGLERYWSTELGTYFYSSTINRLTPTKKGYILVDQKVYTTKDSVNSFVKTCYNLVNGDGTLTFGKIVSLKASTVSISKYKLHENTVEISKATQIKDLCSIRSKLEPCNSNHECGISNDRPSCISKESSSTEDIGAIAGGTIGGICMLICGSFVTYKGRHKIRDLVANIRRNMNNTSPPQSADKLSDIKSNTGQTADKFDKILA